MKILSSFTHIMPFQTTVFRAQCCSIHLLFYKESKPCHFGPTWQWGDYDRIV